MGEQAHVKAPIVCSILNFSPQYYLERVAVLLTSLPIGFQKIYFVHQVHKNVLLSIVMNVEVIVISTQYT